MALHGTIKDFALPDIFQLIGIQKKTGILTLQSGDDTVTLKFLEGQVVGADTHTKTLEDRLGEVLVRSSRVTEAQLQEALRTQKNTLQRLGSILVASGHLSEEDLVEALRVQACQIIYRLFRWHAGDYHFDAVSDLDYDEQHFTPISSETILMEGARMIDEWPIIERRIRSAQTVLRRTEAARSLDLPNASFAEAAAHEPAFDRDLAGPDRAAAPEGGGPIKLSAEEHKVLSLIDGQRTVQEVCDLLALGEFDTCRILADLLTRNLVEALPRVPERVAQSRRDRLVGGALVALAYTALGLVCLVALATLKSNPVTPWRILAGEPASTQLRQYLSAGRLDRIERALQVFFLDTGQLPASLDALATRKLLEPEELVDPWGRPYELQLSPGGYQLMGRDAEGRLDPEISLSRRFNAVERQMLDGGAGQPLSPPTRP